MSIIIKSIADYKFDHSKLNGIFFHPKNDEGKRIQMTEAEAKSFTHSNFVVGYAGKEHPLLSWAFKMSKGLTNINIGMPPAEMRKYLWQLLQTDFSLLDREERRAQGYWTLSKFRAIAETSKTTEITLWTLSIYDEANAKLLVRFLTYLSSL